MTGCFGEVGSWHISRQQMPVLCGKIKCISMDACYRVSFKKQTGLDPIPGFSYTTKKRYEVESE